MRGIRLYKDSARDDYDASVCVRSISSGQSESLCLYDGEHLASLRPEMIMLQTAVTL